MKGVKIKVNTPEQNMKVQDKVKEMNEKEGCACRIYLYNNFAYYTGITISRRALCLSPNWIGFKYLVIDTDGDLILCFNKEIFDKRPEKEVSFEEFMEESE